MNYDLQPRWFQQDHSLSTSANMPEAKSSQRTKRTGSKPQAEQKTVEPENKEPNNNKSGSKKPESKKLESKKSESKKQETSKPEDKKPERKGKLKRQRQTNPPKRKNPDAAERSDAALLGEAQDTITPLRSELNNLQPAPVFTHGLRPPPKPEPKVQASDEIVIAHGSRLPEIDPSKAVVLANGSGRPWLPPHDPNAKYIAPNGVIIANGSGRPYNATAVSLAEEKYRHT